LPEELDQPMRRRDIGAHGMGRAASVMLEVGGPARGERPGRVIC
jgi:hypothetical protein